SAATHRPTLCSVSVKSPAAWLFCAGCTHCTCTHGCGAGPRANGQPAIVKVSEARSTKSPPAFTLVLEVVADTVPPCGHISTLELLSSPAIAHLLPSHLQRPVVDVHLGVADFDLAAAAL